MYHQLTRFHGMLLLSGTLTITIILYSTLSRNKSLRLNLEYSHHHANVPSSWDSLVIYDRHVTASICGFNIPDRPLHFLPNITANCFLEYITDDVQTHPYLYNAYNNTNDGKVKLFRTRVLPHMSPAIVNVVSVNTQPTRALRLRCLPNVMLIGQSKCGTEDLNTRLSVHPLIQVTRAKELFWWDTYRVEINATLSDYIDMFDECTTNMLKNENTSDTLTLSINYRTLIVDMTTLTMSINPFIYSDPLTDLTDKPTRTNAFFIQKILPQLKFLVMLRNPTSRLYSHFNMWCGRRSFPCTPHEFHARVIHSLVWWRNCTTVYNIDICLYGSPPGLAPVEQALSSWWPDDRPYSGEIRVGLYYYYLVDWFRVFHRSQFLVIRTEDYGRNMSRCILERIFPFLGVSGDGVDVRRMGNLERVHTRRYEPMLPETKKILDGFYQPANQLLVDLLESNIWLWLGW